MFLSNKACILGYILTIRKDPPCSYTFTVNTANCVIHVRLSHTLFIKNWQWFVLKGEQTDWVSSVKCMAKNRETI